MNTRFILKQALALLLMLPGALAASAAYTPRSQADCELTIGLEIPEQTEALSPQARTLLENRLTSLLAAEGIASDLCGDIVMMPKLAIVDEQVSEGGLKNFFTFDIEMTLYIGQATTGRIFGTVSKTLKGTGNSRQQAVQQAIKKINVNDNVYGPFITGAKDKIRDFYIQNAPAMMKQARVLAQREEFGQALALLCQIPSNLPGYDKVQDEIQDVYRKSVDFDASNTISAAKAQIASHNHEAALDLLSAVNPNSAQYGEAQRLIRQIDSRNRAEEAQARADAERARQEELAEQRSLQKAQERREMRAHEIRKTEIKAARDAAVAWANSQKKTYYYNVHWW